MYKLGGKRKLGKKASHRESMINNQLRSLLNESKVVTTTSKAKVLKANADSLIAILKGNKSEESITRMLVDYVSDEKIIKKLIAYISGTPAVKIVKVGFRSGDNGEVSKVYLPGLDLKEKKAKRGKSADEKKKVEAKEKEEATAEVKEEKGTDRVRSITRSLRDKVIGKERARTRSGI